MSEANAESDLRGTTSTAAGPSDGGAASEVEFVSWEGGVDDAPRKHTPRLQHKKSRAGCQQCRARRVKCDEIHPVCTNCERHKSACIWGRERPAIPPTEPQSLRSGAYEIRSKVRPSPASPEIPESKDRRLTELRLLHHYQTTTSVTLNRDDPSYHFTQGTLVPRLAFKHDALLYALLATAALHLTHEEPTEPKHVEEYQKYLGLALRLHRDDVATLNKANADAAMITSASLRVCAFALLQEREMEPYTPPIEWLQMNYGTGHGLAVAAWKYLCDDRTSIMRAMIQKANVPGLNAAHKEFRATPEIFNEDNRKDLNHLLERTAEDELEEPWGDYVQYGYSSTVSYIGAVKQAIESGEPEPTILRRIHLFPTMVEKSFIDLVKERRPRALVVLAHFFGILARFRDFWWVGQAGPREVRAIQKVIEDRWQELMEWPLRAIEEEPTLRQPSPTVPALDLQMDR